MIDSVLKLNIDEKIEERNWTPDEFHYLLTKYTDQVIKYLNFLITA